MDRRSALKSLALLGIGGGAVYGYDRGYVPSDIQSAIAGGAPIEGREWRPDGDLLLTVSADAEWEGWSLVDPSGEPLLDGERSLGETEVGIPVFRESLVAGTYTLRFAEDSIAQIAPDPDWVGETTVDLNPQVSVTAKKDSELRPEVIVENTGSCPVRPVRFETTAQGDAGKTAVGGDLLLPGDSDSIVPDDPPLPKADDQCWYRYPEVKLSVVTKPADSFSDTWEQIVDSKSEYCETEITI